MTRWIETIAIKLDTSKLSRSLVNRTKFTYHLDQAIGKGDFEWTYHYKPKEFDDAWHPSGHCTPSLHNLYRFATTPYSPPTSSQYKTFQVGHFWHQFLQCITVDKLGFTTWDEVEWRGLDGWGMMTKPRYFPHLPDPILYQPYHWVVGSADISSAQIPGHGEYLIDFKTMNNFDFKLGAPPTWAAAKWECQVNIYMHMARVERALIVGIQKDSPHELKEFEYHLNQPLVNTIHKKWKLVGQCIKDGVEPPVDEVVELPLKGIA